MKSLSSTTSTRHAMKPYPLLLLLVLGTTLTAFGQNPIEAQGTKVEPDSTSQVSRGKPTDQIIPELTLRPGNLDEVIEQLRGSGADDLPAVIYAPGARELKIAAPLRLRRVRPID